MQISNFVVLSVINAPQNGVTPDISKTCFPIVSLNVREFELNCCSKDKSRKKGGLPSWGVEIQLPQQNLQIY